MIGGAVLLPGRGNLLFRFYPKKTTKNFLKDELTRFETKNLKSYTTFIVVVNVILNPIAASVAATAALD